MIKQLITLLLLIGTSSYAVTAKEARALNKAAIILTQTEKDGIQQSITYRVFIDQQIKQKAKDGSASLILELDEKRCPNNCLTELTEGLIEDGFDVNVKNNDTFSASPNKVYLTLIHKSPSINIFWSDHYR